jgi:hypothetical protein
LRTYEQSSVISLLALRTSRELQGNAATRNMRENSRMTTKCDLSLCPTRTGDARLRIHLGNSRIADVLAVIFMSLVHTLDDKKARMLSG